MPSLPELQTGFAEAVFSRTETDFGEQVVANLLTGPRRLQVYRNNTFTSLTEALAAIYPVVQRLKYTSSPTPRPRATCTTSGPCSPSSSRALPARLGLFISPTWPGSNGLITKYSTQTVDLGEGMARLLVIRGGLAVELEPLSAGEFSLLEALAQDQPFGPACEAALEAEPDLNLSVCLQHHILQGTLVDFSTPQSEPAQAGDLGDPVPRHQRR
jgi:hypothetical protein